MSLDASSGARIRPRPADVATTDCECGLNEPPEV